MRVRVRVCALKERRLLWFSDGRRLKSQILFVLQKKKKKKKAVTLFLEEVGASPNGPVTRFCVMYRHGADASDTS